MRFNRRFYDEHLNFRNLSINKILFFVCISIFSALVFYSFSQVIFETERVISFSFDLIPNIISEDIRRFYNLFFASVSLILGNSIAVNFLFSRPSNLMSRRSLKRKRILNEQIFLGFNFSHWFLKIGWMFGTFAMCCMDFEFSTTAKLIAVLLIIVLYLESWKTLKRVFTKNKWRYLISHALLFCSLSYGLSTINIIDYKAIDKMALEANPIVDLPKSFYQENLDYRYPNISFKILQKDNDELTIRNQYNQVIHVHEVSNEVINERASLREELHSRLNVVISADKHIKLKYIKQIEAQLFSIGQRRITYDVYNEDSLNRSFQRKGITKKIAYNILQFRPKEASFYPPFPDRIFEEPIFNDTLNVYVESSITINGLKVPKTMLVNKFKNSVSKDILINYMISENTTYQDYITVLSAHFKAVDELRKNKQTIEDSNESYQAFREEQSELKMKFPIITKETYNK